MNDRAVSLLENYDLDVLKTSKGRGCILCETDKGLKILQEYTAPVSKLPLMDMLFRTIREMDLVEVDAPVPNKEGVLFTADRDGVVYVVKDYFEGRECSSRNPEELKVCMGTMALLHTGMFLPKDFDLGLFECFDLGQEVERHNALLRKIRKFVRTRGNKTAFELYLLSAFEEFFPQAEWVEKTLKREDFKEYYDRVERERSFIHGDFQYHNVLFCKNKQAVVNFQRCRLDGRVGDITLFLRKIMEKYGWDWNLGRELLEAYENVSPLSGEERRQLFYRMAYPDKFRKIISTYYNSNKAFQSEIYITKLQKICDQETARQNFLDKLAGNMLNWR